MCAVALFLLGRTPCLAQRDVVFVLDRSGSMAGERLQRQAFGASLLVDSIADGNRVGIVSYGADANLDVAPLELTGSTERETIATAVGGLVASGASPIGDALDLARTTLLGLSQPRLLPSIVLLSDGTDVGSNRDLLLEVVPDLVAAGIAVHAIALSELADEPLLYAIAEGTGGTYCLANDHPLLLRSLVDLAPIITPGTRVDRFERSVTSGGVWTRTHLVDATTGSLTVAVVPGLAADDVELELLRPDGFLLDANRAQSFPEVTYFRHGAARGYRIDTPAPGRWTSRVRGRVVAGGVSPVRLDVGLSGNVAAIQAAVSDEVPTLPDAVRFTVRVGEMDPVVGLRVEAQVQDPLGNVQQVTLRDEGNFLDGDPVSGDGEYNARFFGWNVPGLHVVSIRVEGLSPRRVSGVPVDPLQRFASLFLDPQGDLVDEEGFLRVESLTGRAVEEKPERNYFDLTASFDLDRSLGDPDVDTLEIAVGSLVETFDPGTLERRGDRFTVREASRRLDLSLFQRGSSFGQLRFHRSNLEISAMGALDVVPVEIALGSYRRRVVLRPNVTSSGTKARWSRGREPIEGEQWIVDRLNIVDAGPGRGRVDVEMAFPNVLLDPTLDDIALAIGNFGVEVPAGGWEGEGARYRFRLREGASRIDIELDLDQATYRLRGRGLDLGDLGSPLPLIFGAGVFQRRLQILATRRGTRFRYGS